MNNQGIGLGLLVVKQIVDCYDGMVSVESQGPGTGSTFSFNMIMDKFNVEEKRQLPE